MQFTVYALVDPRDSQTRYIGFTSQSPANRLRQHVQMNKSKSKRVSAWVAEVLAVGQRPVIVPLQIVPTKDEGLSIETYWIRHFVKFGANMLNTVNRREPPPKLTIQQSHEKRSAAAYKSHAKRRKRLEQGGPY